MPHDFDKVINRYNTNSMKWDFAEQFFKLKGVLPMWVADMDFRVPEEIIEAIKRVADQGILGYTGVPDSYYDALTDWQRRRHGWTLKKDWVVLSPGVVPAISILVKTLTQPGDKIIVQTPVYYPFFDVIKNNHCEIVDNPLRMENGKYLMDFDDLQSKIDGRTRMLLLCSPHNPLGRVWQIDELQKLGAICREHNVFVVSDEIHEDIVYSGFKHTSWPVANPEPQNRWAVCTSASKTFNLAGLKTSNTIIPDKIIRELFARESRSYGASPAMFGPVAAEVAYRFGEQWLEDLLDYLEGNIDFLNRYIDERIPEVKVIQPEGTYLLWLDFRGCGMSPGRLGKFVREEAKVGLEPGTLFGAKEEGFERMNIACCRDTLAEALHRLEKTLKTTR
jgi:cysteine-S-conjugate beta-lyase